MALNERPDRDGMTPAGASGVPHGCPDAERLAEYADGLLDAAGRAAIEAHLVTCADCRFAVVETMAFLGAETAPAVPEAEPVEAEPVEAGTPITLDATPAATGTGTFDVRGEAAGEPAAGPAAPVTPEQAADPGPSSTSEGAPRVIPFRTRRWVTGFGGALAAAAALVLIVRIVAPERLPSVLGGGPPLEQLVAALETQRVRPVEGRLMGGFAYAPPPSPTRGSSDRLGRNWSYDVTLAAANIQRFAEGNSSARARAALGVALIVNGDLDGAVATLEQAAKELPDDAAVHANLSAAYLARARWWNHPEDWPKALAAADRAIALDSNALEPYFNRALALEGLEQNERAASAWSDYASRDRGSAWTREAEEHKQMVSSRRP